MPAKSTEAVPAQGRSLLVLVSLVCAFSAAAPARAQPAGQVTTREFRASRTERPPVIDGQLSEEVWSQAQVMSDFTQIINFITLACAVFIIALVFTGSMLPIFLMGPRMMNSGNM